MDQSSGTIAASFLGLLYDYVQARGLDPLTLYGQLESCDPHDRVAIADMDDKLRIAAAHVSEPFIGLAVGSQAQAHHLGVLGYIALHADSLGQALLRMNRYQRLAYDANPMQILLENDRVTLRWGVEFGRSGPLVDDLLLSGLVGFARNLMSGPTGNILAVRLTSEQPASTRQHRAFFGCEVEFGQPVTELCFPAADLNRALRSPDKALCAVLDKQASAALRGLPRQRGEVLRVRAVLPTLIRESRATLNNTATALELTPAALRSRLRREHASFEQILDEARFHIAKQYLRKPQLDVTEVALLCGYSELSALSRAWQRWTGYSPSQWRQLNR